MLVTEFIPAGMSRRILNKTSIYVPDEVRTTSDAVDAQDRVSKLFGQE
jgi:hypothetical protein